MLRLNTLVHEPGGKDYFTTIDTHPTRSVAEFKWEIIELVQIRGHSAHDIELWQTATPLITARSTVTKTIEFAQSRGPALSDTQELSSYFKHSASHNLHMVAAISPVPLLRITCLIDGQDISRRFCIPVGTGDTASVLKNAIRSHLRNRVPIDDLHLWRVNCPISRYTGSIFGYFSQEPLRDYEGLSTHFLDCPLDYLNVIVRIWRPSEYSTSFLLSPGRSLVVTEVR
ncbi:hypothetical protein AX16_006632 [Volvariella volvacea WC 439]|nr:hypothetical protein AX16_006632 [Volvariella volvacea WC 439]